GTIMPILMFSALAAPARTRPKAAPRAAHPNHFATCILSPFPDRRFPMNPRAAWTLADRSRSQKREEVAFCNAMSGPLPNRHDAFFVVFGNCETARATILCHCKWSRQTRLRVAGGV